MEGAAGMLDGVATRPAVRAPRARRLLGRLAAAVLVSLTLSTTVGIDAAGRSAALRCARGGIDPSGLTAVGSRVFFTVCGGTRLWTSDGTAAGTRELHRFEPGPAVDEWGYAGPWDMAAAGDRLYFLADDERGSWVWTSDGTRTGTVALKLIVRRRDFCPPGGTLPRCTSGADRGSLTAFGDRALFTTFRYRVQGGMITERLWITDGTTAGTVPLAAIRAQLMPYGLDTVIAAGRMYLDARDRVHPETVWSTDGTVAGTRTVLGTDREIDRMLAIDDRVVLLAWEDDERVALLAGEDGQGGVQQVDVLPIDLDVAWLGSIGGRLVATQPVDAIGATDGTPGGWVDLTPPDGVGAQATFRRDVDLPVFDPPDLWLTDGTPSGTRLAYRFAYGPPGSLASDPAQLVAVGDRLLFVATDADHGREPWTSDGTTGGTVSLDLAPGPADSCPGSSDPPVSVAEHDGLWRVDGDRLFFSADDGVHGMELWASDGTATGTVMVADIHPGRDGSYPSGTIAGGRLFFTADDGIHGFELWTSDGTAAGTRLVRDLVPGATGLYHARGAAPVCARVQSMSRSSAP